MSSVHLEWLSDCAYQARFYTADDAEAAYAEKRPYQAVATLLWYGDSVWISGLLGSFNRSMRTALINALLSRGAYTAFAVRRGEFVEWDLLKEQEKASVAT